MKKTLFAAGAIAWALVLATSCSHKGAESGQADPTISNFAVNQVIKSGDQSYMITLDGDTAYLDQSVSIQWPEKIGNADLKPLKDSLVYYCFNDTVYTTIDAAMIGFLKDTSAVDSLAPDEKIIPLDSAMKVNDDMRQWFLGVTANVIELDEDMVTYQVANSSYLGGAHPFTATRPFTYDLRHGVVLTPANMFVAGSDSAVMDVIKSSLARQFNVSVNNLDKAGIFADQLTYPGKPYIANNSVVFHYNPYDIAPYASGAIDVIVYPYEIDSILTPEVKDLLEDQI